MYVLGKVLDRFVRIHEETLCGRFSGLAHSGLKLNSLELKAILSCAGASSVQGRVDIEIKENGKVRRQAAGGDLINAADEINTQAPPDALVGYRRLRISVADHRLTGSQGRFDELGHMLSSTGAHQEQLRHGVETFQGRIQNYVSNPFAGLRTTGLPRLYDVMALEAEAGTKAFTLGRGPGAVDPLKCDE